MTEQDGLILNALLRETAVQNKFFDPKDKLSEVIGKALDSIEDDALSLEQLTFVQAARGGSTLPEELKLGKRGT